MNDNFPTEKKTGVFEQIVPLGGYVGEEYLDFEAAAKKYHCYDEDKVERLLDDFAISFGWDEAVAIKEFLATLSVATIVQAALCLIHGTRVAGSSATSWTPSEPLDSHSHADFDRKVARNCGWDSWAKLTSVRAWINAHCDDIEQFHTYMKTWCRWVPDDEILENNKE